MGGGYLELLAMPLLFFFFFSFKFGGAIKELPLVPRSHQFPWDSPNLTYVFHPDIITRSSPFDFPK